MMKTLHRGHRHLPWLASTPRVVRRSNALMNYAYGEDFRYDEATLVRFVNQSSSSRFSG